MSLTLEQFVDGFAMPLLSGGTVRVLRPIRPKDLEMIADDLRPLRSAQLRFVRLRRAEELTPHASLPDPGVEELALWVGLHNTLVFDHPDRNRVWTRASTWRRAEGATRTLLTLPFPAELGEGVVRHLAVGAFIELLRRDTLVATATGDIRYLGQEVPRRRFGLGAAAITGQRAEVVPWFEQPHAPETHRLIEDVMRASPLTCLLHPLLAPPGWSPLWAVAFLQDRGFARALCHRWASQSDWVAAGGAIMSALMPSLPGGGRAEASESRTGEVEASETPLALAASSGPLALPGAVIPSGPEALSAVVGALIHLHFLKVLEFDARLGVALGSRDPAILSFLALPLLLPWLSEVTGSPLGDVTATAPFESQAHRRWTEYVDHLQELVPRSVVENLLATLVAAIVQTNQPCPSPP